MKRNPPVFWSEGMFLRPHHFQAAERNREETLTQEIRRIQPFFWGVMALDIAADQLENFTLEVRELEIKMKDGAALSLTSNLRLSQRTFKTELDQASGRMEVWLGIPVWREAEPNTLFPGEKPKGLDRRFSVEPAEVLDENTGANAQPLDTRRINGRLFFGSENREGYECLPLAIVERSGQGKNYPVLSRDFIPPVTEIGASSTLQTLCESVTNRLEAKHRLILSEVTSGRMNLEAEGAAAWRLVMKLQTLGSFTFLLQQLTRLPRIHPFAVYSEFCRLVGELAIFDDSKRPLRVPLYDHDRLGPCFREICMLIEALAEKVVASRYVKVDFILREDLLVADLLPEWLVPETEVYMCLEADYEEKELRSKIETMKVGAVRDIPLLRQRRLFGLEMEMIKRTPQGLPSSENYYYFTIEKEGIYWANVVKDRVMAVSGGLDPKLKFVLYIITKPGPKNG